MNRTWIFLCIGLICIFIGTTSFSQYLYLDSSLTISVHTTYDSIRITAYGRLTADDSITVLGNMIVDSGGIVTHSLRLLEGLRLRVLDTLDIRSGGAINVSAKGLRGGADGGSIFGKDGEAYDTLNQIVAGAVGGGAGTVGGAGASYGGVGANSQGITNPSYGLLEDPHHLGAGGGGTEGNWVAGGHGGGRITLNVNVCRVDGAIRANGGNGESAYSQGGGGSGGGIRINTVVLTGTGTIEANGGNGTDYDQATSGSGGGGRIAVYYDLLDFPADRIIVRGNTGGHNSGAGTIYLKDNAQIYGDLIIDNQNIQCDLFTQWCSAFTRLQNLTISNLGKLEIGPEVGIEGELLIKGSSKIGVQ